MSLSDQDIRAIRQLSDTFMEFMVKKDFTNAGRVYTDDAVLMPPDHGSVAGLSAIQEFLGGFPPISEFNNVVEEIDGRDDMAYVRGRFRMVMEPPGSETVVEEGQYLEIRRRRDDGSWPIAIDIFNPGV